jgi:hypothetical protein
MADTENKAFIKDEYLYLQKVIEDFDARTITIKAWSVSFSLATFAAAFASSAPGVLLVSSGSALLFWFTEAYWKEFQYTYYPRVRKIEKFFAGDLDDIVPMQITSSWHAAWKEDAGAAKAGAKSSKANAELSKTSAESPNEDAQPNTADAEAPRRRPRWLEGIFWRRSFFAAALPHIVVFLAGLLLFGLDQWVWTGLIPERTT